MPKGSKVEKVYTALTDKGMPKGRAAAIAQAKTGQALATGRKAKTHGGKPVKSKGKKATK
jgi:hypothetical protein